MFLLAICRDMEMVLVIHRTDIEMGLGMLRPGIEMFFFFNSHRHLHFVHFVGSTLCKSSKKDLNFSVRTLVLSLLFSRALPFETNCLIQYHCNECAQLNRSNCIRHAKTIVSL